MKLVYLKFCLNKYFCHCFQSSTIFQMFVKYFYTLILYISLSGLTRISSSWWIMTAGMAWKIILAHLAAFLFHLMYVTLMSHVSQHTYILVLPQNTTAIPLYYTPSYKSLKSNLFSSHPICQYSSHTKCGQRHILCHKYCWVLH